MTATWGTVGARVFTAAVLAAHVAAAWFNTGFLSADEHYQIIEFAQFKLGRQSAAALAWEFPERMRSALQPWLAALVIRGDHALGLTSPFPVAFSLRLLSTVAAMIVTLEVCIRCLRPVSSRILRQAAIFLAFFLWIAPTAHARFSSENWGGMWLAIGVCLALDALDASRANRRSSTLLAAVAGAAWGFAFFFRFQVAIGIAGAGLWLVVVRRAPAQMFAAMTAAFAAACALNIVLDHWMYGVWTVSPLNYVHVNLIEGKSAAYGMAPWWLIAVYMFVALVPPFSLALIALLVVGSWLARRDLVVWITVPFVAVHMVVAHKEPRFVMPLMYFLGPWVAVCAAALPRSFVDALARWRRPLAATTALFCAADLAAMCVTSVLPVNDRIAMDRWLWDQRDRGVRTVYTFNPRKTTVPANVTNSFYDSGVEMTPLGPGDVEQMLNRRPAFVYYAGTTLPAELVRLGCIPVFRTFPAWLAESKLFRRLADVETDSICRLDASR